MNCIDAIEGMVKKIIDCTYEDLCSDFLDDTEYIRNTKTAIVAVETFTHENKEITPLPDVLKNVLYEYAKGKWIAYHLEIENDKTTAGPDESPIDFDYFNYYYDYIYEHGVQPY